MFGIRNRFAVLMNAAEQGGDGGGAPPPEQKQSPSFDDIMKATFETAKAERAVLVAADKEITPASPPPAQHSPEPQQQATPPAAAPTPQASSAPPAAQGAIPPEWFQQQAAALVGIQQLLHAQQQALAPKPVEPPKPAPLTTKEIMRGFEEPARERGEDEASYQARVAQASLDHYTRAIYDRSRNEAIAEAKKHFADEIKRVQQEAAQQAQRAQGERQFYAALDAAVASTGAPKDSIYAQAVRQGIHTEIHQLAPSLRTQAEFTAALQAAATKWKAIVPVAAPAPVPGQPPALTVVQGGTPPAAAAPPILGGGGTGPSTKPLASEPGRPQSFDEAMKNTFEYWKKQQG
jgi:hypothetical protein